MPTLAKVDKDGFMGHIYRYVDEWLPASANIILGDLQRTSDTEPDTDETVYLYVLLVDDERAERFWFNHSLLRAFRAGRSLPTDTVALNKDKLPNLQRVRIEDLKP